MRRRKKNPQSSFDLFMDTVCNTFGGVLFIALLIAIQVRHTVGLPNRAIDSSECAVELMQRTEELAHEIESQTILLETIRRTLPEPVGENEKKLVALHSELLDKRNAFTTRKSERTRELIILTNENADWARRLQEFEKKLKEWQVEELRQSQAVRNLQNNGRTLENSQQTLKQRIADLQNLVDKTTAEIAQLPRREQGNLPPPIRTETLSLPKMEDAGPLRGFYLVLRFNRLYVAENRRDFDYTGNALGVPKGEGGFSIYDATAERQIRNMFRPLSPDRQFIGIFVYGDSADSFHIVRDAIMKEGFRYQLIPTPDNKPWYFGGGRGSVDVQ
jgi:hypothetical protein